MKIEREKNSLRNTATGIVNRCVNLLIPFVIRTIIIHKLGSEFLGLNSLFTSIIQVLNLTELGIGNALVFSMYKPIAEDNTEEISGLLSLYKKIYSLIGIIVFVLGMIIMPFLPHLIDMDSMAGTNINVYILFLIYLINTTLTYLFFAYKKSLLMAYQRNDIISTVDSIGHFVMYALQIAVLIIVPNYYLYIMLMPIFTLLDNAFVAVIAKKKFPEINEKKSVDVRDGIKILKNVKYLIGHKIGAVILTASNNIVISAFLSLHTLTVYGNYYYVITALTGFINVGYNAILAGVGNSIITETKENVHRLFKDLSFIIFYIVSFCSIALLCLYQPFMQIWMGPEYMFNMPCVIAFVVFFYTWQIRVIGLNFKDAAGMWKNDALKPYAAMVSNIVLCLLLVKPLGIIGVLLASTVSFVAVYFPWETTVLYRDLFKASAMKYCLTQLVYLVITVTVGALSYFVCSLIPFTGLLGLILKAVTVAVVATIGLVLLCFKMPEFKNMLTRVKRSCRIK